MLQRLCLVAALASTLSMALAACNGGGYGGIPTTPDVPDAGMPDSSDGTQMPDQSESAMPAPGGTTLPQPSGTPIVIAPNNPMLTPASPMPEPSSPPAMPATSASPATNAPFVPEHADRASSVFRPSLKPEGRTVSITTRFNERKIPPGSYLWFDSAFQMRGAKAAAFQMQNSQITVAGHTYTGPTGVVNVAPAATTASVTFPNRSTIVSTFPPKIASKLFMNGVVVYLPAGLPAHQNVTWSARFQSASPITNGMKIQWQWSAAAYSRFSTSYQALRIKPTTGTPENFAKDLIPGPRAAGSHQDVPICPCPS